MITEIQFISADIILYHIFKLVISFSRHRQKKYPHPNESESEEKSEFVLFSKIRIRSQTLGFRASQIDTVLEVGRLWNILYIILQ